MSQYVERLTGEDDCQDAIARITTHTQVKLVPEPDNPNNPRSIKVITLDGTKLGYVDQGSELIKEILDNKAEVKARIISITGSGTTPPLRRIILAVATDPEAVEALTRSAQAATNASIQSANVPASSRGIGCWAILCVMVLGLYFAISQCRSSSPAPTQSTVSAASQSNEFNEAAMIVASVDAKKAVERLLRDPDSAEFRDVVGHEVTADHFVFCGAVNAKNGFGGYQGYRAFITLSSDEAYIDDGKKEFRDMWEYVCTEKSRAHQAYF